MAGRSIDTQDWRPAEGDADTGKEVQDRWRQMNHSAPLGHSELAIQGQRILGDTVGCA
jgi:hypothetical protein